MALAGNVRELRNVLEHALIFAPGPLLEVADLPPLTPQDPAESGTFEIPRGLSLKEVEREYLRLTLEAHDGGVADAAELLGISRKNLWEKRKRHGL